MMSPVHDAVPEMTLDAQNYVVLEVEFSVWLHVL